MPGWGQGCPGSLSIPRAGAVPGWGQGCPGSCSPALGWGSECPRWSQGCPANCSIPQAGAVLCCGQGCPGSPSIPRARAAPSALRDAGEEGAVLAPWSSAGSPRELARGAGGDIPLSLHSPGRDSPAERGNGLSPGAAGSAGGKAGPGPGPDATSISPVCKDGESLQEIKAIPTCTNSALLSFECFFHPFASKNASGVSVADKSGKTVRGPELPQQQNTSRSRRNESVARKSEHTVCWSAPVWCYSL